MAYNVSATAPAPRTIIPWHLNNRNKRGMALDLKVAPGGRPFSNGWSNGQGRPDRPILRRTGRTRHGRSFILNTMMSQVESPFDLCRPHGPLAKKGPDASLPGFDVTAYLVAEWPALADA